MTANKPPVDSLYDNYANLIRSVCKSFIKSFPSDELADLTQSAWEQIIKKYGSYEPSKSKLTTWLTLVTKSAMYDLLDAAHADKREVQYKSYSLDEINDNNQDKIL